jgi:L-rhamnose mutarotase
MAEAVQQVAATTAPLEQIAFKMQLHPGQAEAYRQRHDALWPELAALLHEAGVRDYSIFLDPQTHLLLAVLRRTPDHRMDALPAQAVMQRWWQHMADLMRTEPDGSPWQAPLMPMFHLD